MKVGMQVGLSPGHTVTWGPSSPSPKGAQSPPIFGPYQLRPNGCMDQDITWYGARPRPRRLRVRWGPRCPLPQKGVGAPKFSVHVYCGQTAGWIKAALGTELGVGPCHIVLDGDQSSLPQKGAEPQFSPHLYCSQTAGCITMPLGMGVRLRPDDFVLDGDPAPTPKGAEPPNFRPTSIVAKRLHASKCHLV